MSGIDGMRFPCVQGRGCEILYKQLAQIRANKTARKAKEVASPYFGANDFAFSYAVA